MIYNYIGKVKHLIIFFGESNSGGRALNSQATQEELSERSRVKRWDNINNDGFYNLEIPVNSLLGHTGLSQYIGICHGMDLALSNYVYDNHYGNTEIYIVNAGQGGSMISDWLGTGYNAWNLWKTRVHGAINAMKNDGIKAKITIIFSLGINDAINGTSAAVFETGLKQLIANVYAEVGICNWYATRIMRTNANYIAIDNKLEEVSNEVNNFKTVSITGAGLQDSNHWSYSGFKIIVNRMITAGL